MAESEVAPRAVLLDIEGTVTPLSFVYETLFPYTRAHGPQFIREHWEDEELQRACADLARLNEVDRVDGAPVLGDSPASAIDYYLWLVDRDRKVTPLKLIQGLIWQRGFDSGVLQSDVFADVPPAFERWRNAGQDIAIYSSGSVLAQQNVFRHSNRGDLTRFIDAYFDTRMGGKREPASYEAIAKRLGRNVRELLFVSDSLEELDSAASAGLRTALCIRPGNAPVANAHAHRSIESFEELS